MRRYPHFFIKVDDDDTPKFLAAIDKALCNGWSRGPDRHGIDPGWPFYNFFREPRPGWDPICLCMVRFDSETIQIVNIVPNGDGLTIDKYKEVLADFRSSVLDKVLDADFEITLLQGSDEEHIEDFLSPVAFKFLESFSTLANKRTGSSHFYDRQRWQKFLISIHRTPHALTDSHLQCWALEQGFQSDAASNLALEFNFALDLLKLYDDFLAHRAKYHPELP